MTAIDKFVAQLRRNLRTAAHADTVAAAFAAANAEANENGDALEWLDGIVHITKYHVSLAARVRALTEYLSLKGQVRVKLHCDGADITVERL